MNENERISEAVVRRLPGYYRHLRELEAEGTMRLSSQALGARMGLTASQIRQDINCFGEFGQQGYGYHVPMLKQRIAQILGIDTEHNMVIVGAGNIGLAVANYPTFSKEGFRIHALFDVDPSKIGRIFSGVPVLPAQDLAGYLKSHPVDILVLATPASKAQEIVAVAAGAGIRAIWNFAPIDLPAPEGIIVGNVHLSDSLMSLAFRMHERDVRAQDNPTWIKE